MVLASNKAKADEELENEILPALNNNPELKWMLIVNDSKECDTNDVFKAKKLKVERWKDYAKTYNSIHNHRLVRIPCCDFLKGLERNIYPVFAPRNYTNKA